MSDNNPKNKIIRNRQKFPKDSSKSENIEIKQPEIKDITIEKTEVKTNSVQPTLTPDDKPSKKLANKIPRKFNVKFNYQEYLFGQDNKSNTYAHNDVDIVSPQQMVFDIPYSKKEPYYNLKRRLIRLESMLEIIPFWKNLLNVFTLIFGVFIPTVMGYLIYTNYDNLKNKMPLFFNHTTKQWESETDKGIFILLPFIILGFNMLLVRLNIMMYNFDRKLVYAISFALIIVNILVIISFIQILYLVV